MNMAVSQNRKESAELEIYFTLNTEKSLEQFHRTLRKRIGNPQKKNKQIKQSNALIKATRTLRRVLKYRELMSLDLQ